MQEVTLFFFLDEGAARWTGQGKKRTGHPLPVNPLGSSINHRGEREGGRVCVCASEFD